MYEGIWVYMDGVYMTWCAKARRSTRSKILT